MVDCFNVRNTKLKRAIRNSIFNFRLFRPRGKRYATFPYGLRYLSLMAQDLSTLFRLITQARRCCLFLEKRYESNV